MQRRRMLIGMSSFATSWQAISSRLFRPGSVAEAAVTPAATLDEEKPERWRRRGNRRLRLSGDRGLRQGNPNDKLAPATRPVAHGCDGAVVQVEKTAHQRQAYSQARHTGSRSGVTLPEEIEDAVEHLGLDTDAIILDREQEAVILPLDVDMDFQAFFFTKFDGIGN